MSHKETYRARIGAAAAAMRALYTDRATFQGEEVRTVPRKNFLDPNRWSLEVDRVFKRLPLMLALSCELPSPGDFKAMMAVDKPVLLTRGKDGVVRAFLNVCAHRGAPVAPEGRGNCSRFSCPFHGWTYGDRGQLMGVAENAKFGPLDKSLHGLRALPCEERHGLVFASLTPGHVIDLDGYFEGLLDEYAELGLADYAFVGSRELEGANWKIAFDTFIDGYHFRTLHPNTVFPKTPSNMQHLEAFGPHLRIGYPHRSIGQLDELSPEQWADREGHEFGFIRTFFPNVTGFAGLDLAVFTQNFPGPTADRNRTVLLFARREKPEDEPTRLAVEELMDWYHAVTRDEDYAIGWQIQKGMEAGAFEAVLFGRNERGNQYFHEWLDWYLAADQAAPRPIL